MPKIIKFFLILFILILIVFFTLFYLIKTNRIAFLSGFFDNLEFSDITFFNKKVFTNKVNQPAKLSDETKVVNLDNLTVNGLNIIQTSNKNIMVSTTIQNTSDKKIDNLNLCLYLYISKKIEIASFNFSVEYIQPESKSTLLTKSNVDLSESCYYRLVLDN